MLFSPKRAEHYLVDEALLESIAGRLGGELAGHLKITVVHPTSMLDDCWVVRRRLPLESQMIDFIACFD